MIDEEADDPVLQAKLKETKVKKAKSKRSRRAKAKKRLTGLCWVCSLFAERTTSS